LVAQVLAAFPARADDLPAPLAAPSATVVARPSAIDWLVRFQVGLRSVTPSPQQDLLDKEGFSASPRYVISGEFARTITPSIGVSGWADFSMRSNRGNRGPQLTEDVLMFGAGVPWMPVGWQSTALLVVPRFGYGWSWMSIGGHAEPVVGPGLIMHRGNRGT